jgi:energy-coupling factor transport system permease protein
MTIISLRYGNPAHLFRIKRTTIYREEGAMFKDITLGQYLPGDSVIHHLDPRTKIAATGLYVVALLGAASAADYLLLLAWLLLTMAVAAIPPRRMLRGLRGLAGFLAFMMIFSAFWTPGTALWQWRGLLISREGLLAGLEWGGRIILLLAGTELLTCTTTPLRFMDGLERFLRPLRYIGVSGRDVALMMTLALRFLPIMSEEAQRIHKAQVSRGAYLEQGAPWRRIAAMVSLLTPLFTRARERAEHLSAAIVGCGYSSDRERTSLTPLHMTAMDYLALFLAAAVTLVVYVI